MSTFYWIMCGIAVVAFGAFYAWCHRRAKAEEAAEWLALDARLTAEGEALEAQWNEWEAEIARRVEAMKLMTKNPPHIISLLVGEDYPRFGVFNHHIRVGARSSRRSGDKRGNGKYYPYNAPGDLPDLRETYVRMTRNTFDSQDEAEQWLVLYLNPEKRQTEHNVFGTKLGAYGAVDAEREAGGI